MSEPETPIGHDPLPNARRTRSWRPYPLTVTVAGCVLAVAFVANYPAVATPRADLDGGKYGILSVTTSYEHGWPVRYSKRPNDPPASIWKPWEDASWFSTPALLWDAAVWLFVALVAALVAQQWRSRRRALWQPRLIDLIGLTTAVALAVGWVASQRIASRQERALIADDNQRRGYSEYIGEYEELDAAYPLVLPEAWRPSYIEQFGRVQYTNRDSEVACQFSQLKVYSVEGNSRELRRNLRQMSQLEGIDFLLYAMPYSDATRQTTILHSLPPLPNLRVISLHETSATDSDMAWLAKCRRLEVIDLSGTDVGDEGIRILSTLPRLRKLTLGSGNVTDEGCRRLAAFPALEELQLAGRKIHDDGVRALGRARQLRMLNLSANASKEVFAELRDALPDCEIDTARY